MIRKADRVGSWEAGTEQRRDLQRCLVNRNHRQELTLSIRVDRIFYCPFPRNPHTPALSLRKTSSQSIFTRICFINADTAPTHQSAQLPPPVFPLKIQAAKVYSRDGLLWRHFQPLASFVMIISGALFLFFRIFLAFSFCALIQNRPSEEPISGCLYLSFTPPRLKISWPHRIELPMGERHDQCPWGYKDK